MGVLADFIRKEAEELRKKQPERDRLVKEWTSAVALLLDQMEVWLKEADTEGVLSIQREQHEGHDSKMGRYAIDGLYVTLGNRTMRIKPAGRWHVGGATLPGAVTESKYEGRVDFCENTYGELHLYRVRPHGEDRWVFVHSGGYSLKPKPVMVEPLDQETFEGAVLRILR